MPNFSLSKNNLYFLGYDDAVNILKLGLLMIQLTIFGSERTWSRLLEVSRKLLNWRRQLGRLQRSGTNLQLQELKWILWGLLLTDLDGVDTTPCLWRKEVVLLVASNECWSKDWSWVSWHKWRQNRTWTWTSPVSLINGNKDWLYSKKGLKLRLWVWNCTLT